MKYYKKLKQYKASNLKYDENSKIAYSYDWYQVAKFINNKMILNTFNYSATTLRHVYKIRKLFDDLGIEYLTLEAPQGLQNLESSLEYYKDCIGNLRTKINNPRSRKSTNVERSQEIDNLQEKIGIVETFIR